MTPISLSDLNVKSRCKQNGAIFFFLITNLHTALWMNITPGFFICKKSSSSSLPLVCVGMFLWLFFASEHNCCYNWKIIILTFLTTSHDFFTAAASLLLALSFVSQFWVENVIKCLKTFFFQASVLSDAMYQWVSFFTIQKNNFKSLTILSSVFFLTATRINWTHHFVSFMFAWIAGHKSCQNSGFHFYVELKTSSTPSMCQNNNKYFLHI